MDDFQSKVRKTRNDVLNRPEYRMASNDLNRRMELYNKAQILEQKQAVRTTGEEELEK